MNNSVPTANADLPPFADASPLFIVGSMRSGTTWVRNLLRRVPGFICPEETHFMRWSDPFRTPASMIPHQRNKLLQTHRHMDGVPDDVFEQILSSSPSKSVLQRRYIDAFAAAQGVSAPFRWFDKTPQNIYGLPLILAQFPKARVLHLVRNPLNVVASLQLGKQVHVPDLHGAINCWMEAVQIWDATAPSHPDRMMEVRYEDLLSDVVSQISGILDFAEVPYADGLWSAKDARAEPNQWRKVLDHAGASQVARICGALANGRGYDLRQMIDEAVAGTP